MIILAASPSRKLIYNKISLFYIKIEALNAITLPNASSTKGLGTPACTAGIHLGALNALKIT